MRRCKRSVSFFGYVKERSYPKGYNRKCILCYGDIRIYCRRRVPLPLCFSVIPLSSAHTTRMDVNARGSISLSVHGTLADKRGQERTRREQSWTFTTRRRIPRHARRNRRHLNNHRICRHQCR